MVEASSVRLLRSGVAMFAQRLATVRGSQWGSPTPCVSWTVADLVGHVVAGNMMATELLGSPTPVTSAPAADTASAPQLENQFAETCRVQAEAFAAALSKASVGHPAGQITAQEFAIYRCADIVVHAWDLARAIGADDTISPELVKQVLTPYVAWVRTLDAAGVFASARPNLGGGARQDELLRQLGRDV